MTTNGTLRSVDFRLSFCLSDFFRLATRASQSTRKMRFPTRLPRSRPGGMSCWMILDVRLMALSDFAMTSQTSLIKSLNVMSPGCWMSAGIRREKRRNEMKCSSERSSFPVDDLTLLTSQWACKYRIALRRRREMSSTDFNPT
jgi:hypothetical protein